MNRLASFIQVDEECPSNPSARCLKVVEIFRNRPMDDEQTDSISEHHTPMARNHFDRLPDELIETIITLAATGQLASSINLDPYEVDWKDEEEVNHEAISSSNSFATFRLVSWRFFQLTTPLFLRRLVIRDSDCKNGQATNHLILRLSTLLSTINPAPSMKLIPPPQALPVDQPAPIQSVLGSRRYPNRPPLPYGHHVHQLIIKNPSISPTLIYRLLDAIHSLIPNLRSLCGLSLSHIQSFFSPTLRFPRLASFTRVDLSPSSSDLPTVDYPLNSETANLDGMLPRPTHRLPQEVFLGILNHHPYISHLSCRGLKMNESESNRLLALLRHNQLSTVLLSGPQLQPDRFLGLRMLHIGLGSTIELQFVRLLPRVAPKLLRLHLDAGCQFEAKSPSNCQSWSLQELWRGLPELTHWTFIGQHDLPKRQGSVDWASSNQLFTVLPMIQSLNLRMDSLRTTEFFKTLGGDSDQLKELNVWYRSPTPPGPTLEGKWSIIFFESREEIQRLGRIAREMISLGLDWPVVEEEQRDLWFKLKSLCRFTSRLQSNSIGNSE